MMMLTTLLGVSGAIAFLAAGFTLGARRGLRARDELRAALEAARETPGADMNKVEQVLAPLFERERVAHALSRVDVGRGTRDELPRLLEAIANTAGFTSVVLSDEVGLPLASNDRADDAEIIAGIWSLLLTIADRVAASGAPAPLSVVVHDAEGRAILHRIFSAGRHRFLLTAVSRSDRLAPESLDPALANLERVLTRDTWQESA